MKLNLEKSWLDLIQFYGISENTARPIFMEIMQNYSGNDRHYHNLEHISEMLFLTQQFENQLNNPNIIRWSIWFHDVIYKAIQKNNEEKSAEFARTKMQKMNISEENIQIVFKYILATKTHLSEQDTDLQYFIDFDLAILGASAERYESYQKGVRKEYAYVPSFLYRKGRKKVLQNFLNRPKIFLQLIGLEKVARKNINQELKGL